MRKCVYTDDMSDSFGIDVGVGTIKIVSIVKGGEKGLILDSIGETKTPRVEWFKGDHTGKAMQTMVDSIKKLMSDLKLRTRQVTACLPEDEIASRVVHLPPLKEGEIKDALAFEAETFVPYPLDQVSIDYEIVEKDDMGRLTIFAIAAKKDLIKAYMKLFKMAGLDLVALESPAVSMRRVLSASVGGEGGVMMVDMGEKYSDLICVKNGNICFTRSMSVGGESLTRAISINLGMDMASAEEYKKAYGMRAAELEGKIKSAIEPVFVSMADEIRKGMSFYTEEKGGKIDLLVLSGGGANLPGLAEELTKLLGVEVQVIQPFLKIDTSKIKVPIDLNGEGCRFSLAIGLALRGLL